jgi:exosome complex component RRP40
VLFYFLIIAGIMATLVLPGDEIPAHILPTGTGKRKTLKLGPGLRHIPPSTVVTTIAGALVTDNKKNAASIEFNSGRVLAFFPSVILLSAYTYCSTSPTPATSSSRP